MSAVLLSVMPPVLLRVIPPLPDWLMPLIVSDAAVFVREMSPLDELVALKPVTALEVLVRVVPPTLLVVKNPVLIGADWVIAPLAFKEIEPASVSAEFTVSELSE